MRQDIHALVIKLTSWAQEELGAQRRMHALLAEQERAVRAIDSPAITASGARIEEEIAGALSRERRRTRLLKGLGQAWGVDPNALTLASVCERAGDDAAGLLKLRGELRDEAARAVRLGRRITALARYHGGLLEEVMQVLVGEAGDGTEKRAGVLVDAEA